MPRALRRVAGVAAGLVVAVALALVAFRLAAAFRESKSRTAGAPPGGRFLRAGDVEIYVQEEGPADGTPVLLVHGTGAWSEIWRETMRAAAAAGYRCIALDMPPFGFSERPARADYGDEAQARRILGVLDALGIASAVLVGHSFGGRPTVEATFLAPERVRALVLVDAALDVHGAGSADGTPPWLAAILGAAPLRDALVAATVTNPLLTKRLLLLLIATPSAASDERLAMFRRPLVVVGSTPAVGGWLEPFVTRRERSRSTEVARYGGLAMPTLVLWGARDDLTPPAQGRRIAGLIPGAELAVLPTAGHIPAIEDPARFNAALVDFLRRRVPAR